jgi:NADH dehydrogenase FAD-containing subunit
MITNSSLEIEKIIQDYIEQQRKSNYFHKKKTDAEKEYNKLLVSSGGETKNFSLEEANKIYNAFKEIEVNEEYFKEAENKFNEADEKMKELGHILFHATISAEITIPPVNGEQVITKQVTISFPNGQVVVK